jgi:hypothetical protein
MERDLSQVGGRDGKDRMVISGPKRYLCMTKGINPDSRQAK